MRKLILLLLVCVLCLTGCAPEPAAPSYAFDDLSIQIPEGFIDLSEEEFAEGFAFVFGLDPIAINGLREEKATFAAYGLQIDLERYGKLVIAANNQSCQLTQTDGIWNFSYEAGDMTYVVTLWETEEAFWTVQGYCPTEDYHKVKKDLWNILSSVTV